jgi:hypothetical protein
VTTTALTVGGTDLTAAVAWGSMTCKLNTLDFTLVDPAYTPVIGDVAALTIPSWSGTVVSVAKEDPVDRAGHVRVIVSATNQIAATASASASCRTSMPAASCPAPRVRTSWRSSRPASASCRAARQAGRRWSSTSTVA